MIATTLACAICITQHSESDFNGSAQVHEYTKEISDTDRDIIWRQMHVAVNRMNGYIQKADQEASSITEVNIRQTTKSIIKGCICCLGGRAQYSVVIGRCLGALSHVGGEAYDHFVRSRDYIKEAEFYAYEADRLNERLWRDE